MLGDPIDREGRYCFISDQTLVGRGKVEAGGSGATQEACGPLHALVAIWHENREERDANKVSGRQHR